MRFRDEHTPRRMRYERSFVLEEIDSSLDRDQDDAVPLREVPPGRDPLSLAQLSALDQRADVVGDLDVRRPRVVAAHAHVARLVD